MSAAIVETPPPNASDRTTRKQTLLVAAGAGAFVVAIALLYGSTMAPSPRDGVQPVEYMDEAFYAVLGRDLRTTGTEANWLESGFSSLDGATSQNWYHWGELWLAAAMIAVMGAPPIAARYFIVLPVILLAAAVLTGTLVRRLAGTASWRAYVFGFVACLFLAPLPWVPGPFFSSWAMGLVFGITFYGMASVAALTVLFSYAVLETSDRSWALYLFVGSTAAFIVPAHIVVAALGFVGTVAVVAFRGLHSLSTRHRLPSAPPYLARTMLAALACVVATFLWGSATGHSLGGTSTAAASVVSFNETWRGTVEATLLGAAAFLSIPIAAFFSIGRWPAQRDMYVGTIGLLVVGAVAWGARLGDFNMFHVYFGGIAVFATPAAAVAIWTLLKSLRAAGRPRLASAVVVVCGAQLVVCFVMVLPRMQRFGPRDGDQIPISILSAIERLPRGAEIAYVCRELDEVAIGDPRLISIDAHTEHRVVPLCYEADVFSSLVGATLSPEIASASFVSAPQRILFPDAETRPSPSAIRTFLKSNGIDYMYEDANYPNSLGVDAIPIASSGGSSLMKIR